MGVRDRMNEPRVALDDRHSTFARPVGLDTFVTVYRGPTAIGLLVLPGGGNAADVRLAALEYLAELDNASK